MTKTIAGFVVNS